VSELTAMDSKLAEVLGLAMAAQKNTDKIAKLLESEDQVASTVQKLHDDAVKVEEMTTELISSDLFTGKKTAILDQARETKLEAIEMATTYLGEDADSLDGFEFLTMTEAGELGHWKIVEKLNEQLASREIKELTDFVVPMEEGHFQITLDGALTLAAEEDALAPA
jgi:hypothetical protein